MVSDFVVSDVEDDFSGDEELSSELDLVLFRLPDGERLSVA